MSGNRPVPTITEVLFACLVVTLDMPFYIKKFNKINNL